jgi:3-oxoacyl-[acyl-carrier protein] reductase
MHMFHNKHVVVTGAGRGIGRALALAFAAQGATVLVHYNQAQKQAEEVVCQIESEGGQAILVQANFLLPGEAARLVILAREKLGTIDVWLNNAGASANSEEVLGLSEDDMFEHMMAIDVRSTWRCSRDVAPYMNTGGSILTIGWDHALDGSPGLPSQLYAMSKGAIISLTRCLAQELAPRIRVNCIAPGAIENEWALRRPESFRKRIEQGIPMQRWGTPEDIVAAALFLASPAASFITGQILLVDGGDVMR